MAEEVGFEPTEPAKVQRFSRPPPSTARTPLHTEGCMNLVNANESIAQALVIVNKAYALLFTAFLLLLNHPYTVVIFPELLRNHPLAGSFLV